MLPLGALTSMRVFFATPCFGSACMSNYLASMFNLASHMGKMGMECRLELGSQSSITHSRNRLVAQFLSEPNWTHLFWWDADVSATPEQCFRILLADRDVVAGVYPLKRYIWPPGGLEGCTTQEEFEAKYTPYPFNAIGGRLKSDEYGFGEVAEATTGFMCIKRDVFTRMIGAYQDLHYLPDDHPEPGIVENSYCFFSDLLVQETRRSLTEDYAFCHRWREIGGKVWVDIHSKLNHMGQHTWRGDLFANLKAGGVRR